MKTKVITIGGLIIIGLVIFVFNKNTEVPPTDEKIASGMFGYECTDGIRFSMTPSEDMKRLTIYPGMNAKFPLATLTLREGVNGERYEGSGIIFMGAGEDVRLTSNDMIYTCTPQFSSASAPFNWGDEGEGGGTAQDAILAVAELLVGGWQSKDDVTFSREFKSDGTVVDTYTNSTSTTGTWNISKKDNDVIIQITDQIGVEVLNFKLGKLTPEDLQLVYLIGGETLHFVRR